VRVWARCTEWLTQAVAMLALRRLLMHLLILLVRLLLLLLRMIRLLLGMLLRMLLGMLLVRHLVLSVRRDMLVDWLHVSLITHHTQMRTITRSNARCVRELILELLLGRVYRCRPLRFRLLLAKRWKRIRRMLVSRRRTWALRRRRPLLTHGPGVGS